MAKRKRNTNGNYPGTGAFLGSIVGGIPGNLLTALGSPGVGGVLTSTGWIVGGGIGGHIGAKSDRKRRGAIGGAIGGIFTPLGAALGGYIGGRKPDAKRRNPAKKWLVPGAVAGALAIGTVLGLAAGKKIKKKGTKRIPSSIPEGYDQILCNPYKGHKICVYSLTARDVAGQPYDAYDANIDGGAMLGDSEYPFVSAEAAIAEAQNQIDAFEE